MNRIYLVAPEGRVEGQPTPGMIREEAVATDRMWGGFVTTDAGMASGWHHHGSHETAIYVLSGVLRMEWGPGGRESLEARPGDFIYVGKDLIHRESNPSPERSSVVVVRSGEGEVV